MSSIASIQVDAAAMAEAVRDYLQSPEAADRHSRIQWIFDHAMELCLEEREAKLAFALLMLIAFRSIDLDGDAAGLLASRFNQIADSQGVIAVLTGVQLARAASQVLIRRCRTCGCTQERACPGGCRWVEDDLCSRCATYPYPACINCNTPAPLNAEEAFRADWVKGSCAKCNTPFAEGPR